ncbi:MAG: preprotein translocase subunit SecY [Candidatus Micrarchaeota archaeon]|nr:preprotein translocase subunit SecY [Candidatus Micrarchaeota archaeon]
MGSSLDFLKPILKLLPEVSTPSKPPTLSERLMWTAVALCLFFIMYHIMALGVQVSAARADFLQVITASKIGSLITVGIGPIVLASIFLQLFAGAKIIQVDLSDPEQKRTFQATQKLLAIILCFLEAALFVIFARLTLVPLFGMFGEGIFVEDGKEMIYAPYTTLLVIFQIAMGSLILLYLDEVVSKYGFGSGISLFIAAGVSQAIIGGMLVLFTDPSTGVIAHLASGSAEALPSAIMALLPLIFTVAIMLVVSYAEGIKVEIPLAFSRATGTGSRFPIKFLYVSNIPVILASALILNLQFFALSVLAGKHWCIGGEFDPNLQTLNKCRGGINLAHLIGFVGTDHQLHDGLLYFISPIYRPLQGDYGAYFSHILNSTTPIFGIPEWVHVIVYVSFMVVLCIIFGQFWVETTNMSSKDVAQQLDKAGLQIPGFRRDPRIVEKVLDNYIPYIVILGSAFVGLLAAIADMTGALGTGTGILLTVGILYRLYQDLENQRLFDSYVSLANILGKR